MQTSTKCTCTAAHATDVAPHRPHPVLLVVVVLVITVVIASYNRGILSDVHERPGLDEVEKGTLLTSHLARIGLVAAAGAALSVAIAIWSDLWGKVLLTSVLCGTALGLWQVLSL